jgi:hypothetical protein
MLFIKTVWRVFFGGGDSGRIFDFFTRFALKTGHSVEFSLGIRLFIYSITSFTSRVGCGECEMALM